MYAQDDSGGGGGEGAGGKPLCFFGIENSEGYQGDGTIRALVKAIEEAAHKLPSLKRSVPLLSPMTDELMADELMRTG